MSYLGLRVLAGALWAAAVCLIVAGTFAVDHSVEVGFFVWGIFFAIAGGTLTVYLAVEHALHHEGDRNARHTAEAVGEAVGAYLMMHSRD